MKTQKRRRRLFKTDYKKRIAFLKSNSPRIVFRRTNKYIIAQYIESNEAQDRVRYGLTSKHLLKYGWPKDFENSLKSLPASYLIGLLLGKYIRNKKTEKVVIDSGISRKVYGGRFFAFLNGLKDSGVNIKCNEEFFPSKERIKGKDLKRDFSKFFDEIKKRIEIKEYERE
ncbi:MAG: 50S ribosomal protein L18 [Candidatus Pacearchaeota archaeon]